MEASATDSAAKDLDEVHRLLKDLIILEGKLYRQAIKQHDSKDIRAHAGLLAIFVSNTVKVILAKHHIGIYEAGTEKDLASLLMQIEEKEPKKTLKRKLMLDLETGEIL